MLRKRPQNPANRNAAAADHGTDFLVRIRDLTHSASGLFHQKAGQPLFRREKRNLIDLCGKHTDVAGERADHGKRQIRLLPETGEDAFPVNDNDTGSYQRAGGRCAWASIEESGFSEQRMVLIDSDRFSIPSGEVI